MTDERILFEQVQHCWGPLTLGARGKLPLLPPPCRRHCLSKHEETDCTQQFFLKQPSWRKRRHPIFEDKHPGCIFQLSLPASETVWVCIYALCLLRKGCASDCMTRNQKSGWTLHCMMNHASSCKFIQPLMVHGLYIYRFALALYPGSLNTRLCLHSLSSDFTMANHPLPFLSEHLPSSFTFQLM